MTSSLRLKIGTKIIGMILISVVVSAAALTGFNTFVLQRSTMDLKGEELSQLSKQVINHSMSDINGSIKSLQALSLSPDLIQAVEEANRSIVSDKDIALLDQAWQDEDDTVAKLVDGLAANNTSASLQSFLQQFPEQVEVFVTDQQGLIVGMSSRTGDYLQSDEGW